MLSKYSSISKNTEEVPVDENGYEEKRNAWLHFEHMEAFGLSTHAVVAILVAITLVAGIVGVSVGALVFRSSPLPVQIWDTVPQGRPPSRPSYE